MRFYTLLQFIPTCSIIEEEYRSGNIEWLSLGKIIRQYASDYILDSKRICFFFPSGYCIWPSEVSSPTTRFAPSSLSMVCRFHPHKQGR
jgi:hypothetical protein